MSRRDSRRPVIRAPGAHVLDRGVLFRLWAPTASSATLRLTHDGVTRDLVMERADRGYWETSVDEAGPGDRYLFSAGGGFHPDPASRSQPDGVHRPSELIDLSFDWSDADWTGIPRRDCVFYELHVGTFTEAGTLDAIGPELDRLASLGVTAVELMPVSQFPGERNWGYDGVYPWAVQNSYGGPDNLARLVECCHQRGLALFLDVVYNHLGPEGNYLAQFGPYFTDRYRTPWGEAVNFDGAWSDGVREYFIGSALSWMRDFHVDGLRIDAVHAIRDHSAYPFLRELADRTRELEESLGRKLHLVAESDLNDPTVIRSPVAGGWGMDAQWSDDFHHSVHAILTGESEGYYGDFGEVWHLEKSLRDVFVYDGRYSGYRRRRHGSPVSEPDASRFVISIQNHDQVGNRVGGDRLASLVSFDELKLAAGLLLLAPFTPLMFMGEEMAETHPFLYFTSHSDANLTRAVREGREAGLEAFGWEGDPPDPDDPRTFERSRIDHSRHASGEGAILHELYRELLALRRTHPALRETDRRFTEVSRDGTRLDLVRRSEGGRGLLVRFNLGDDMVPRPRESTALFDSSDPRWSPEKAPPGSPHGIAPHSFVVFETAERR